MTAPAVPAATGLRRARVLATAALLLLPVSAVLLGTARAQEAPPAGPTPTAECGPGSLPETDLQGRIPPADVASGRAAQGYTCNAEQVGFLPSSAGWRVERYGDCAYYNGEPGGAPLFVATDLTRAGTYVVDVSDPEDPVETAFLRSPAMLTPHESMNISQTRGLLVAVVGNLGTLPGVVDVYDIATDCRQPRLLSSVNVGGLLGHEGGLSPDGNTFYVGSAGGGTLTAVDITDPALPVPIAVEQVASHGLSLNADGTRLYDTVTSGPDAGMIVYDVSGIQAREPGAGFRAISRLSWPEMSIPQSTIPVTIGGRPYVIESDEFSSGSRIGASRIIDISDETAPRVVSNLRLEVHEPANAATVAGDTPALIGGPYSGHFCSVPRLEEPGIVACAMLRSGVRVFDITDPLAPREVAYFSPPAGQDCSAAGTGLSSCLHTGSTVAFVPERSEMWVSGQESGFHVVRLTNGVFGSAPTAAPPAAPTAAPTVVPTAAPTAAPAPVRAAPVSSRLPATGPAGGVLLLAAGLLAAAAALSRSSGRHPGA
jgi:hypothetical protein